MPHLFLEYSQNLERPDDLEGLALRLHRVLQDAAQVPIGNCKSRWRAVPHYAVGKGSEDDAFVHLTIRLLEGRDRGVLRAVGEESLRLVRDAFAAGAEGLDLQVTVEIAEMARDGYFKYPEGTL